MGNAESVTSHESCHKAANPHLWRELAKHTPVTVNTIASRLLLNRGGLQGGKRLYLKLVSLTAEDLLHLPTLGKLIDQLVQIANLTS